MTKERKITIDERTAILLENFANKTHKSISEIVALVCTKSNLEILTKTHNAKKVFGKQWDKPLTAQEKKQIEQENAHFPEDSLDGL